MNANTVVEHAQNRHARLFVTIGIVLSALLLGLVFAKASPAAPPDCSGPYRVDKKLSNGATWQLCWEIRENEGLSLSKVIYTPRGGKAQLVLGTMRLAALHVPYDPGEPRFDDMGGLGGGIAALVPKDCPSGELRKEDGDSVPIVCVTTRPRGFAYRYDAGDKARTLQGQELAIFTVSQIGWYTYVTEYTFADDGSIHPRLAASGSLTSELIKDPKHGWPTGVRADQFQPSHSHIAYWRVDFDVQGNTGDVVEQYDFAGSAKAKVTMSKKAYTKEGSATLAPMRWWRVVDPKVKNADGHRVSWEIVNDQSSQFRGPKEEEGWSHQDVYVTQYKKCEALVQANYSGRCAMSADQYTNNEKITDPVVWVGVSFHHVARDEDEDPMPMHWQGFSIVPRDVTARSPLPPSVVPIPGGGEHAH